MIHPLCGLRHLCAVALRQGRYKAILLDGDAIAGVSHYIHLNPVRAGIAEAVKLETFVDSSFYQLWKPRKRWNYAVFDSYLDAAGILKECPKGRRLYRDYLGWLSEEDAERKRLGFERMTRGWAKGSKDFKKNVLDDFNDENLRKVVESDASEMREPRWERGVGEALRLMDKTGIRLGSWPQSSAVEGRNSPLSP